MNKKSNIKNWLFWKYFVLYISSTAILIGIITALIIRVETKSHQTMIKEVELAQVEQLSKSLAIDLDIAFSSLKYLSEQHELQRFLNGDISDKTDLANMFLSYSQHFCLFDQIRYLDNKGMEIVRVNYNSGKPSIVPNNQLQSKARRYYFDAAFSLDKGSIYVSQFDLNIEEGEIEKPLKPIIRFGTPVFDNRGVKKGIVLLNYFGARLLSNFDRISALTTSNLSLLNPGGYWLKGPNPGKEWGFMYKDGKKRTFGNTYPKAWELIKDTHSGQTIVSDGLFTFTTIHPIPESSGVKHPAKNSQTNSDQKDIDRKYYWKILSHVTSSGLTSELYKHFRNILLIDVAIFFILMIVSFVLARVRVLRAQTGNELRKLTQAVEDSPTSVMMINREFMIEYVNPKFIELTGYRLNEVIGKNLRVLHLNHHPQGLLNAIWITILSGDDWRGELLNRKKNGKEYWESTSISSIFDSQGKITHFVCILEDVTKRKRTEDQLKKLSQAVEQSPAIVLITDLEGNIEYINPKFTQVTGYTFDEAVGKTPSILSSGIQSKEFYRDLWQTIKAGKEWQGVLANKKKNGELYWESITISPIWNNQNEITHFLAVEEDITKRKKTEKALEERVIELDQARRTMLNMMKDLEESKQKAEEATQAKSEFLANMSHEIRTPMNAIMGMAQLCSKTELTPKQTEYISKIRASSTALLGIINDILDFSKIEAGKLSIETVDFDLNTVLEYVASLISTKAQEKKLEFLLKVSPDTPMFLIGDPLRLGQVLINLANNAAKFTNEGEVIIFIESIKNDPEEVTLQFTVKDTGIGLTPGQITKLFAPFSQADSSTTRQFGGTGLGLSICKNLVNLMKGDIWVESEPGIGSSFIFTSVFKRQTSPTTLEPSRITELEDISVLVIDDNDTSLEIFEQMLKSFSFYVTSIESGFEGVEILEKQKHTYDLILVDWKMPGMDGIEMAAKIRSMATLTQQPKIILATAYDIDKAMNLSSPTIFNGFIAKPVTSSSLLDVIATAFGKTSPIPLHREKTDGDDISSLLPILGAHLLIVEDNEINQQVAVELLEGTGFMVDVAENGEQAVEMVQQGNYQLVLMDIQMPVMDGYEATRQIRKTVPSNDLPIVAMTASTMIGDREKAINAGMDDHVAKPIDLKNLYAVLEKWIKPGEYKLNSKLLNQDHHTNILPNSAGLNTILGLTRIGGNKKLYHDLLVKFYRNNQETTQQIRKALDNSKISDAQRITHTIKGVAGNIGAVNLQAAAFNLEMAINEEKLTELDKKIERFNAELKLVIAGLKKLAESTEAAATEEISKKEGQQNQLAGLLNELDQHLEKREPKPCKNLISELGSYRWPDPVTQALDKLSKLISRYKFQDAQQVLKDISG